MKVNFVKLSPTENMTLLVTTPVARCEQPRLAERLMAYNSVYAEQVGFVEAASVQGARARLQMMGGEFCGNASMSLAVLLAHEDALKDGESAAYALEVSGAAGLIHCKVRRAGNATIGSASMPLPREIGEMPLLPDAHLPVVYFPGIVHVLVPENYMTQEQAERLAPEWCDRLDADALGILLINEQEKCMRPLVYVRSTQSSVWERGCGSGTAAIGAYYAYRTGKDVRLELAQPGGSMSVCARVCRGNVCEIEIEGRVELVAEGCAYIKD